MADLAAAVGGAGGGHSEAERQGIFMDFSHGFSDV
jgi:hypothetical protein